jgi:hypothetical protein
VSGADHSALPCRTPLASGQASWSQIWGMQWAVVWFTWIRDGLEPWTVRHAVMTVSGSGCKP